MFLVTSPIVINVPTRGLLAVETMHAIVRWLANLNIKRNMTSMFVNKKHRYYHGFVILWFTKELAVYRLIKIHHGRIFQTRSPYFQRKTHGWLQTPLLLIFHPDEKRKKE